MVVLSSSFRISIDKVEGVPENFFTHQHCLHLLGTFQGRAYDFGGAVPSRCSAHKGPASITRLCQEH
jgi:hypothetical protein